MLSSRHCLVFGNATPENLAAIARVAGEGKLAPFVGRVVPLSEAIPAIIELEETGAPKGKLVIAPMRQD